MKKRNGRKLSRFLLLLTLLMLGVCLLVACGEGGVTETTPATDTPTDATTEPVTDAPAEPVDTTASTDASADTTPEVTEALTEELKGWEQDTGKFNDGIVDYEMVIDKQVHSAYPDDQLGRLMSKGDAGVINTFHADFSDNDATCGGNATVRATGATDCRDGVLYSPFDANSPTLTGGSWTTWAPNPSSSVKTYKQAQLSLDWSIVSAGDGAWLNAVWGCYVSNYSFKIPDNPGDGLWISFNPVGNKISIYHPDDASWPAAWAHVPVEEGMLNGKHHVDIITSPDYSTYVYVTPEGGDTARLVCTVLFADGKISVYNEANEMIKESNCTTNALQGEHYSLFVHGGGGAQIDNLDLYAASKGDTVETVTVTATPTEGNSLGLDITDKTDLVSICYSVWFDAILGKSYGYVDRWHNITEILAGNQEWGGSPSFHYWAKPALGYYCSSNKEVIRTHMTQLYTAGVDFIIIDLTNAGDGYLGSSAWIEYIQKPMDAILDTIMEMRAEGLGTPYVVFWVGDGNGPLYKELYDKYHAVEKWKDCFVYWDGKPLMLTTHKTPADFPYPDLFTVRSMWGLGVKYDQGQWSFLSINNKDKVTNGPDGKPEQVSVAVASQETYMSMPTAHGREGGMFWYAQWCTAFEYHPKIVTLTWWNEWTAQRLDIGGGQYVFTDNYNEFYSRDIEPMEGGHGDQYYQWMIKYISAYKGGLECPVLIEDEYREKLEKFMKKYERGQN
ncbi:MAG: hypothetical protein IJW00_09845 [Clostridia bacterium]|nr:hypothetical protein [Clostridia bacterium]